MKATARAHPRAHLRRADPGFTLVELMAALTGGLIFSLAVFALSRDSSRFYQREARVAEATLATLIGFERLRADIARAGFMVSPNIDQDPKFCRQTGAVTNWPGFMPNLVSIQTTPADTETTGIINSNLGRYPDAIILAGNYTSTDDYDFAGVDNCSTDPVLSLRENSGGLARHGYASLTSAQQAALLAELFPAGRILRIVDDGGWQQYAIIESTSNVNPLSSENIPSITLSSSPPLRCGGGAGMVCGLTARTNGAVNVVNFIRYSIRSVRSDTTFAPLFSSETAAAPGEATRTELVREELDPGQETPTVFDNSTELVAEYAVDLQFGETVANGATATQLTMNTPAAFAPPQRVRAVRAQLSVRSREADRDTDVAASAAERTELGLSPTGIYRFGVGDDGGAPYARVRTMQADIALHNQSRVQW